MTDILSPLEAPVKLRAGDLVDMLRRHYEPPPSKPTAGAFITEIQAPKSLRRADALWCPITTGDRGKIIGHEIKVSRSDLITELHDPHKADTWLKYCHRWWLVISDEAFLDGLDIPSSWGILVPPKRANTRFMHVVQKAPDLKPAPSLMQEAWGTIFARQTYGGSDTASALTHAQGRAVSYQKQLEEARAEVRRLGMALGEEVGVGKRGKVADILSALERLGGYGDGVAESFKGLDWSVEPETIAKQILAATLIEREVGTGRERGMVAELDEAIVRAERAATRLREAREQLTTKGSAT